MKPACGPRFRNAVMVVIMITAALPVLRSEPAVVPEPKNQGRPLNSPWNDFAPSISPDGTFMVFNSRRHGQRYQDIYISEYTHGSWTEPIPFTILNSRFNDETPCITGRGDVILFASDRNGSTAMPPDSRGRIRISFDLYWSHRTPSGWIRPERIPGMVNTRDHERAPCMSPDMKTLYYTSWPFGNSRASRIMSASWRISGFDRGRPMPAPVNSGYQDMALIHDPDGLYFASKRPGGHGGWDIWFVPAGNGADREAVNMGPLINSSANEIYYSKNRDIAYFNSNRKGGLGKFDIYRAGFDIHSIYFDHDSARLKKKSHRALDEIAVFMKQNSHLRFMIIGHTDLHGTEEYNLQLSLRRADAVKEYLVKKGLDASRFTVRGAGESEPAEPGTGPGYDEKNRRTEFRVLGPAQYKK